MSESSSQRSGFLWGVAATVVMSLFMLVGMGTGAAPMPEPIPRAIVTSLLGSDLPQPLLMGLAIVLHLGYGGFWGSVFVRVVDQVSVLRSVGLGVLLWLLMQVMVLPLIGWGFFGSGISPAVAVATLVLHFVYGGVLGWGLSG